jgi:hypothetical protein
VYRDGYKVLPGLVAYEEIKLDDVPLGTDLRQLLVLAFDKALMWTLNADQVGPASICDFELICEHVKARVVLWGKRPAEQ